MLLSAFQCLQDSQGVNSRFVEVAPGPAIKATLDFDEDHNDNQWKKPHGIGLDEVGLMSDPGSSRFGAALAPHCSDETMAQQLQQKAGCPAKVVCLTEENACGGGQAQMGPTPWWELLWGLR